MNGLSVVIPSKTSSNLVPCFAAVRQNEPRARIIVIDDGLQTVPAFQENVEIIQGIQPFCFARNVNLGIQAAGDDDVVVLNDDALLQTPGGFSLLQRSVRGHLWSGIVSSTTNVTGNLNQQPRRDLAARFRIEPGAIAFIAVLLPRTTIDRVGLMDERFGGLTPAGKRIYGWCDNDYCRRVRNAGLNVAIHDGCFVDHASLRSTFRGHPHAAGDTSEGAKLYKAKWGDLH